MKYALAFLALASAVTAIAVPKKAIDAATADSIIASSAVPSVANSVQPVAASVPSVAASITSVVASVPTVAASVPSVVASVSGVDSALSVAAPASSDQAATTSIPSAAASTSASGSTSLAAASISPTTVPAPSNAALTSSAGASASTAVDSVLSVAVPSSAPSSLASVAASVPIANKAAAIIPEAHAQAPSAQSPPAQAPASVAPAVSTPVTNTPAAQPPAAGTPAISAPAVAALATTTVISYLPPLSKSEVNEQHKSYVHAKFVPESAASQVIQALKTQGIVVPSAVVPFQSQQTEVRHSGVENIVEFIEKADYHANPDVEAHPEGGNYYLKYFKGTSPKIADDYAKENNAYLPLSIFNPSKTDMCIFGGATDLVTGKVTPFAKEGSKSGLTPLAANSTVQFGNYIHLNNVNGRIQALFGCDKECNNCAGAKEGPIHTLFEFMHADHAPGQQVHSWFNPSNVDGYSTNFNVTVFNDDAICKRRACHSTPKEMKKTCPERSLWHDKGIYGCKSECKVTGRDDHCCVGAFGLPTTCAASSGFLHELCTDAYSWPYDDKEHTDTCEGTKKIHLVFAPIGQMAMIKYPEEGYPVWNSS